MSTKEKSLERVMERPPRKDIEFEEVEKALEMHEFTCVRIHGSHCIFKNKKYPHIELDSIPMPHGGRKTMRQSYIDKIQTAIEEYNKLENMSDEKE